MIRYVPLKTEWGDCNLPLFWIHREELCCIYHCSGRQISDVDRNSMRSMEVFLAKARLFPRDCQMYWIYCWFVNLCFNARELD